MLIVLFDKPDILTSMRVLLINRMLSVVPAKSQPTKHLLPKSATDRKSTSRSRLAPPALVFSGISTLPAVPLNINA
jgi:hypothetical protein